jgi:hypothetical protein
MAADDDDNKKNIFNHDGKFCFISRHDPKSFFFVIYKNNTFDLIQ